jgi:glyoxylase-like metal-dependent hydrolase (beta-lactamase superfamily II)/predicted DCC family thiol-disulfide oxidoreductase YuxK
VGKAQNQLSGISFDRALRVDFRESRTASDEAVPSDDSKSKFKVLYDGQCEICQASISWLKVLDRRCVTRAIPVDPDALNELDSRLRVEACLRELHVLDPGGKLYTGWDAVARLAGLFPCTWILGAAGSIPPFKQLGRIVYGFIARNRHSLSKCRGGACQVARPDAVRRQASPTAFWSCYTTGFFIRLPLVLWSAVRGGFQRLSIFFATYDRKVNLLGGKLTVFHLNGFLPNAVPLLFGELFTAILYDGVMIDPGSTKMRGSLVQHLRGIPAGQIQSIVATHAHEEHIGNLNWLAKKTGASIYVASMTAECLQPPARLPRVREIIIGQPPPLEQPFQLLQQYLPTRSGRLKVISTPGHCDDHVSFYDPNERLLFAGDAFMGTYFATPNPDVQGRIWLDTLQRLSELEIDILVEGHGHIHTLRTDIPDIPGIVIREHPSVAIAEKLEYMRWLRQQIEAGMEEGLAIRVIEASCFPWSKKSAWENFASDEMIRLFSLGHFSRTELVRSFVRGRTDILPTVYQVRFYGDGPRKSNPS